MVPESEPAEKLHATILSMMNDRAARGSMAEAAGRLGRPDAANIIAKSVMERINAL
jgi:UDP-N-acetylglucosamine:LPS N-acetylglucosamine transferase